MEFYITKYCLTRGILLRSARKCGFNMIEVERPGSECAWYVHSPFWHEKLEDAIAHAEELRIKKLKNLDKQMKKISAIVF
jgi:hypothetical protein